MNNKIYVSLLLAILVSGCQNTKSYGTYEPHLGSIHSAYPVQFKGSPKTPNERLQANSRGEYSEPIYSCLIGSRSVAIVGHMVQFGSLDKKQWPEYGYLSRAVTKSKAADGTNNFEAYFLVENVDNDKRNEAVSFYGNAIYKLSWNDEKLEDGWMHGDFEFRGLSFYDGDQVVSNSLKTVHAKAKCTTLDKSETIISLKTLMSLSTMTPEQKSLLQSK